MHTGRDYASFLVRLWSEPKPGDKTPDASWWAEVESIQTGDTWRFSEFGELAAFLESALPEGLDDPDHLETS